MLPADAIMSWFWLIVALTRILVFDFLDSILPSFLPLAAPSKGYLFLLHHIKSHKTWNTYIRPHTSHSCNQNKFHPIAPFSIDCLIDKDYYDAVIVDFLDRRADQKLSREMMRPDLKTFRLELCFAYWEGRKDRRGAIASQNNKQTTTIKNRTDISAAILICRIGRSSWMNRWFDYDRPNNSQETQKWRKQNQMRNISAVVWEEI